MATAIQPKPAHREDDHGEATHSQRPIWEAVAQIGAQIPDDEWEQVPEDSSINYKQHLYGAPAQSE